MMVLTSREKTLKKKVMLTGMWSAETRCTYRGTAYWFIKHKNKICVGILYSGKFLPSQNFVFFIQQLIGTKFCTCMEILLYVGVFSGLIERTTI